MPRLSTYVDMIELSTYGDTFHLSTYANTMYTPINSIRDLAAAARGARHRLRLSQAELADRAGVSRAWLNEFEAAKPTAELGLVIRLFDALGLRLAVDDGDRTAHDRSSPRASVDLDALLDDHRQP